MTRILKRCSFIVVFLLFAFSSGVLAEPITISIAEKVGATFLKTQDSVWQSSQKNFDIQEYKNHTVSMVSELKNDSTGDILAYVFALEPRGFVVVSPDTNITPIIAYSFEGDFNWEDSDDNALLNILKYDMRNRIESLAEVPEDMKNKYFDLWVKYFSEDSGFLNDMSDSATYGPLLSTTWHQDSPYNSYCPTDPSTGKKSIVGCVATAMAQIVNYHACTSSITFTSDNNYTTDTRKININATTANMSSISYPASNDTAARLSYACGVSVKMDYTSDESAAMTSDVAAALTSKFGFTSATAYAPQSGYGVPVLSTFYEKLQQNMEGGKPAQLAIQSSSGGHSIVCDGYNSSTGQYHLNFGWGSSSPTSPWWYTLPTGMPSGYTIVKYGVLDIKSTCHPSCPELYTWNGEEFQLVGFLYTKNHSPGTEDYQFNFIETVVPTENTLRFLIKEIDKEISYINSLNIFYKYLWDPDENWFSLPFISALHNGAVSVTEDLLAKDDKRVYMKPGDEITVRYGLPAAGMENIQIVAAGSGYYLWTQQPGGEVLSVGPALNILPGDTVTLWATINNIYYKPLDDTSVLSFVLQNESKTPVGTVSIAGLAPASPQTFSFEWTVPADFTAGTYTYMASIFSDGSDISFYPYIP